MEEFKPLLDTIKKGSLCKDMRKSTRKWWSELNSFRQDEILCDVTLLVGPDEIPMKAHRVILACGSKYFKAIFTFPTTECNNSHETKLPFVDKESMEDICQYLYSGSIDFSEAKTDVLKLAVLSSYLGIQDLQKHCSGVLEAILVKESEQCLRILTFADRYGMLDLKQKAKKMFAEILRDLSGKRRHAVEAFISGSEIGGCAFDVCWKS